jgi:hypothetical protein
VDVKKYLLNKIIGLARVPKDPFPYAADYHCISTEQAGQGFSVSAIDLAHQLLVGP